MRERGGLLVENEAGSFGYPHRSFQEYLAARWLLTQADRAATAAELATADIWREVVLLACGRLKKEGETEGLQGMILELAADPAESDGDRRRLLTAGQAWLEFGAQNAVGRVGAGLAADVPRRLTALMQDASAPAAQRLDAGLIAADLGARPPDLDLFVDLSGLSQKIEMGKYPVTNLQYRRFLQASGYTQQVWWSEEGWRARQEYGWTAPRYLEKNRFNRSTLPVVGVSWHEAVAYCAWLTDELRRAGKIDEGHEVRLPTRDEWTRAVRGDHGHEYPWGENFDLSKANTSESKLEGTTPVHMYADCVTVEGVWDLAGNVWEWCNDLDDGRYPYLTGGCWTWGGSDAAASAAAVWDGPWRRYNIIGFRCCVASISF